jgi:hypothetical protein
MVDMDRRIGSILLVLLVGCTTAHRVGDRGVPGSGLASSAVGGARRARTTLMMEVGPSVHPGSFRAAGTLTERSGDPVSGASVTVLLIPFSGSGGPFDLGTRITNVSGFFQVTFHLPASGTYRVEARFAGDEARGPASDEGPVTG